MLSFFKEKIIRSLCERYPRVRPFICPVKPLVYSDTLEDVSIANETVLVLSPNEYWVLQAELNVKSEKEAARYGGALFDLNDEYRYVAQKSEDNRYVVIAYNPTELSQRLIAASATSIKKMAFAQWVFDDITRPVKLPSGKYLTLIDGIVMEIDSTYIDTNGSIKLSDALSTPRLFLKTVGIEGMVPSEVTTKTLRNTLIVLLIFLGNLLAIGIVGYQENRILEEKTSMILSSSKLPETSFEREALIDSLKKKEKKQLHIREVSKEISLLAIEGKIITPPPPALPSLPPVIPPSADGVVLIPGSKPGEANRLIVDNTPSIPSIELHGEGIRELSYDGNGIYMVIDADDANARNSLKNTIMNRFKHAQINEHNTQIEVRLK